MKKLLFALVASAFVFAVATPVETQGKIKIAIWDFENNAPTSYWFHSQMGPAARNHIDTAFSQNAVLSAKFSVIEREKLGMVMKEQGLAQTGAVDPQSAAKVGKLLGVRYIVTGGIDKFAINNTKGGIGGFGANQLTAEAEINLRFIDTTTAERIISIAKPGKVNKGGVRIGSANLSRDAEWGIASEAIEKASKAVVDELVLAENLDKVAAAAGSTGGIDARVIKVDGKEAYINLGTNAGVKVGDKFTIFHMGEELIDPVTGAKLGAPQKQVGTAVVTQVEASYSIVTVTGTAAVKDVIKKQ